MLLRRFFLLFSSPLPSGFFIRVDEQRKTERERAKGKICPTSGKNVFLCCCWQKKGKLTVGTILLTIWVIKMADANEKERFSPARTDGSNYGDVKAGGRMRKGLGWIIYLVPNFFESSRLRSTAPLLCSAISRRDRLNSFKRHVQIFVLRLDNRKRKQSKAKRFDELLNRSKCSSVLIQPRRSKEEDEEEEEEKNRQALFSLSLSLTHTKGKSAMTFFLLPHLFIHRHCRLRLILCVMSVLWRHLSTPSNSITQILLYLHQQPSEPIRNCFIVMASMSPDVISRCCPVA